MLQPLIPHNSSFFVRILWSAVLKTFLRSMKISKVIKWTCFYQTTGNVDKQVAE